MSFNKEEFARLLKLAKGDRSLNQYGMHSGVSAAHISRLMRSLLDTAPNPDTIKLLAEKAYNEVSYNELMRAAGHFEEASEDINSKRNSETPELTIKDELDMAKRMEKMKKDLIEGRADGQALLHKGEPMSEEAIDSLIEAIELAERITTLANKKFAPNKYKDKE